MKTSITYVSVIYSSRRPTVTVQRNRPNSSQIRFRPYVPTHNLLISLAVAITRHQHHHPGTIQVYHDGWTWRR